MLPDKKPEGDLEIVVAMTDRLARVDDTGDPVRALMALGAAYASVISYGICAGLALVAVMRLSKSIRATTLRSATEPSEA